MKLTPYDEGQHFDARVCKRRPPYRLDIIKEYYDPRTALGTPKWFYRKALYDEFQKYKGKKVLNVCCGTGFFSILLAELGLDVVSFDISIKSVEYSRQLSRLNNCENKIQIDVLDVTNLPYQSNCFEIITGEDALHHIIKYDGSLENLYRVLKPGGKAVFWDGYAFNPLINLLRNTNVCLKKYKGEHFLDSRDIGYIDLVFDRYSISLRSVFYTFSRFFKSPTSFNRRIHILLKSFDDFILSRCPALNRCYSIAFLEMMKDNPSK